MHLSSVSHLRREMAATPVLETGAGGDPYRRAGTSPVALAPEGLSELGEFTGFIRTAAVVPSRENPAVNHAGVWTGEKDGSIVTRRAYDGVIVPGTTIQGRPRTYVNSMAATPDAMWCGLSDGYLRVFGLNDRKVVFEKKKHTGSVSAVLYVRTGQSVFTGGEDFKILQWDALDQSGRVIGQFAGHTGGVRSLVYEEASGHILSGSDDGFVKCWNVESRKENTQCFPIAAHQHGVKAMALSTTDGGLLYTAGRGGVAVWAVANGALLRELRVDDRKTNVVVTTVCLAEATGEVWGADTEGHVNLWSTTSGELLGRLYNHGATVVPRIELTSRATATKLYTLTHGALSIVYAESDGTNGSFQQMPPALHELHETIAKQRSQIIENFTTIEGLKDRYSKIRTADARRKAAVASSLHRQFDLVSKRISYERAMTWCRARRHQKKRAVVAEALLQNTERGLRWVYFTRLVKFANSARDQRQRRDLAGALMRSTSKGLQTLYFRRICDYVKRQEALRHRKRTAELMLANSRRGMALVYLRKWYAWCLDAQQKAKRDGIAASLLKSTQKGMLLVYFNKLRAGAMEVDQDKFRAATASVMLSNLESGLRFTRFGVWMAFTKQAKRHRRLGMTADALQRSTELGLMQHAFRRLLALREHRRNTTVEERYYALSEKLAALEADVHDPNVMTPEEIDAADAQLRQQLAVAEHAAKESQANAERLMAQVADLEAELASEPSFGATGRTPIDRASNAMATLKPKAISCRRDAHQIADLHFAFAARKNTPENVLSISLATLRGVFGVTSAHGEAWAVSSEDIVSDLTTAAVRSAGDAIRAAILAWDHMVARGFPSTLPPHFATELTFNKGWLMEIVRLEVEIRDGDALPAMGFPSPGAASPRGAASTPSRTPRSAASPASPPTSGRKSATPRQTSTPRGASKPAAKSSPRTSTGQGDNT